MPLSSMSVMHMPEFKQGDDRHGLAMSSEMPLGRPISISFDLETTETKLNKTMS